MNGKTFDRGKVLIVDDQMINIRLLQRKLERNDYDVLSATNGPEALEKALKDSPDVILLDIMMPGMDGIEVCQRLKEQRATRDIPVIFITARNTKEGKIEGLHVGAADYLTKPIDLDETLARVHTQVRVTRQHKANLLLNRELQESRRRQGVMHMTEGVAHNLNNLLGVAVGYVGLIRQGTLGNERLERNCGQLELSLKRMGKIVEQLTIIGQFQEIDMANVILARVLEDAESRLKDQVSAGEAQVEIVNELDPTFSFFSNHDLLAGVLERLLINAWQSYPENDVAPGDRWIRLQITQHMENKILFDVQDRGAGIPDDIRDHVFDPFVSTSSNVGRGMGLTLAQHAVISMKGKISLADNEPQGIRALVEFPILPPEANS